MSDTDQKRQPPEKESQPASDAEGPRGRTLRHMGKLLARATGTAASAMLIACESCGPTCCDPLPAPLRCQANPKTLELGQYASWSARWVAGLVVEVQITTHTYGTSDRLTFSADPQLTGATVVKVERKPNTLTLTCQPDAGATTVKLRVPLSCNDVAEELLLRFSVDQSPTVNANVPVEVDEQ